MGIAGAGILGGLGFAGQTTANMVNRQLARENREWMEHMSNTRVQRTMADLKAAGVNPMLVADSGSGLATGAGGSSQQATVGSAIGKGIEAMGGIASIKNTEADTKLKTNQQEAVDSQVNANNSQVLLNSAQAKTQEALRSMYQNSAMKLQVESDYIKDQNEVFKADNSSHLGKEGAIWNRVDRALSDINSITQSAGNIYGITNGAKALNLARDKANAQIENNNRIYKLNTDKFNYQKNYNSSDTFTRRSTFNAKGQQTGYSTTKKFGK